MFYPFYPHLSGEDILKIMSGEDRFVRVEIPGSGNPIPKIFLPRGLKHDQSILVQHQIYTAYWNPFLSYFNHEAQHWACVVQPIKGTRTRVTVRQGQPVKLTPLADKTIDFERYSENTAAVTTMVFRNPEFLYHLNQAFINICETYTVDIRLFWQGNEYLRAFEHDPKFEIPAPDYRVCPSCGKRFVPVGRNAWKQRYCTPDHEEKARYRRAYLRRKERQGKLSLSEEEELHGLDVLN